MITWQWQTFDELGPHGLYAVLALRQRVFVLEQQCLYPDLDGHDQAAMHLLGWHEGDGDGQPQLAAYLRVLAPGAKYVEMSLGRVLTAPEARTTGAGKQLLAEGIARAVHLHAGHAIRIGAQQYLERFYQSFGFVTVSAPYDEDGIQHIDMLRAAEAVAP